MDEISSFIGPGTAGLTQRIIVGLDGEESGQEANYGPKPEMSEDKLYAVRPNKLLTCGHNQY